MPGIGGSHLKGLRGQWASLPGVKLQLCLFPAGWHREGKLLTSLCLLLLICNGDDNGTYLTGLLLGRNEFIKHIKCLAPSKHDINVSHYSNYSWAISSKSPHLVSSSGGPIPFTLAHGTWPFQHYQDSGKRLSIFVCIVREIHWLIPGCSFEGYSSRVSE